MGSFNDGMMVWSIFVRLQSVDIIASQYSMEASNVS